jgi:hypothetical protein
MVRVLTLKKHVYNGRTRRPGDIYEARPGDLRILQALGAEAYTEPKKSTRVAAQVPVTPEPEAVLAARRYKRRDMKAE